MAQASTWREYISWDLRPLRPGEVANELWPKRQAYIARARGPARVLEPCQWGVPRTMLGKRPGTTVTKHVTNVRNLASPFWRNMLNDPAKRCLVPFTRFAERKPGKGPDGLPAAYWFSVKDRPYGAFAGIWRMCGDSEVFAFLTCEPNPLVAEAHPKAMPVILHEADYDAWLGADYDGACALATPFPSQLMAMDDA